MVVSSTHGVLKRVFRKFARLFTTMSKVYLDGANMNAQVGIVVLAIMAQTSFI